MATRRDFVLIAETLRTTPLTSAARARLTARFAYELDGVIPGFDPDKFTHEATRGTRENDEQPTITLPPLEVTLDGLRADWTRTVLTDDEQADVTAAPDLALASALAEGVEEYSSEVEQLVKDIHDVATDAVLRKALKVRQRAAQ